jgi:hypothetical protein
MGWKVTVGRMISKPWKADRDPTSDRLAKCVLGLFAHEKNGFFGLSRMKVSDVGAVEKNGSLTLLGIYCAVNQSAWMNAKREPRS